MPEKLSSEHLAERISNLHGWALSGASIVKSYRFKDYHQTIAFVNAVAWIAHQTDHHPDLEVGYSQCVIRYSTHDAGGVTEKDLECAERVESLGTL
jgi:4a-hydroxytetrahydrobiopterin dehydratase